MGRVRRRLLLGIQTFRKLQEESIHDDWDWSVQYPVRDRDYAAKYRGRASRSTW